jgi:hypothetical protein
MDNAIKTDCRTMVLALPGPTPATTSRASTPRILMVFQDNLLSETTDVKVDFIGTGITITPFGQAERLSWRHLWRALACGMRLVFRRYDAVIIPAIDADWMWDQNAFRKRLRKLVVSVLGWKLNGRTPLLRWLLPKSGRLCVLDRYDRVGIQRDFAQRVGADVYLKTNLPVREKASGEDGNLRVDVLPFWLHLQHYPETASAKDVDIFFAAQMNSGARRAAAQEIEALKREGFHVVALEERLDAKEYVRMLQRSRLTLSPEGYGFHCFRHYEAMLARSVPVISRPREELVTDLETERNCLFYDAGREGDLCAVVRNALKEPPRLEAWAHSLRQFALERHSLKAVGQWILENVDMANRLRPA